MEDYEAIKDQVSTMDQVFMDFAVKQIQTERNKTEKNIFKQREK